MAKNYRRIIELSKELQRLQNSKAVKTAMAYKEAECLIRQKVEVFQEFEEMGEELISEGITLEYIEELQGHPVFCE